MTKNQAGGSYCLGARSVIGFAVLARACIPYGQNANRLVVGFLKRLKPCNKLFDGCRVVARTEAIQFQIGVNDGYWLHGPIGLKVNFRRYTFDVSMRFESYWKGAVHRVSKVGDA
jgi:hypothetical protein